MAFTTNQIKGFAKNSQYIQAYLALQNYNDNHPLRAKLGRRFNVKYRYDKPDFITDSESYFNNEASFQAYEHFKNHFGTRETQHFFSFSHIGLKWFGRINFNLSGAAMLTISRCDYTPEQSFNRLPFFCEYSVSFPYSGEISESGFSRFVVQKIEGFLYKEGLFRKVQIQNCQSKKEVKLSYKYAWEQIKTADKWDYKTISRFIKRRCKAELGWNVTIEQAVNFLKSNGPFQKPTRLEKFDGYQFDNFDGTLEELETEFWNSLDPEVVYI